MSECVPPCCALRSDAVQILSGFQSPTHGCAERRRRRPRFRPPVGTGAPPLPRPCQRPAPHCPRRTGAATPRARADDRSHNPVRCQPARAQPAARWGQGRHSPTAPPPPAAAAQPAAPGTIFCRRPGLGGGYQPPQRRRRPTRPSAPGHRAPGAARRVGGSGVGRSRCSGPWAPRGDPRPRAETLAPEAARAGRAGSRPPRVCYCQLGPSAAEHAGKQPAGGGALRASAQTRKSLTCRDGRGSARRLRARLASPLSCPDPGRYCGPSVDGPKVSLTFWPRRADPARPGTAPVGEPEAEELASAQLRGPRRPPECPD
ncbi:translation initiation factor IF-2-like [Peromyscus leucopus]|uniref:translation initiation factor IF-2-like n=1 Tax=Peromyscus leucopus TaxID=10041 RepID=UPI0010A1C423|nr:translation initiation factor IF-2-like [Peromyscus leucopus]